MTMSLGNVFYNIFVLFLQCNDLGLHVLFGCSAICYDKQDRFIVEELKKSD